MHPDQLVVGPTFRAEPGSAAESWVTTYLRVREREGRLYPDEIVRQLPHLSAGHPLHREWRQRADSANRLVAYLARRPAPLSVLEVGCGNGWLAHRVAAIPGCEVVGLDANRHELDQAERVFADRPNLRFVEADARVIFPPDLRSNVAILASVIQYVPDLPALLVRLAAWLRPGGEIHLLDSPFYAVDEVAAARERTRRYYAALGAPEMAALYRHHTWRDLDGFPAEVLYRPSSVSTRLQQRLLGLPRSPFPWIRIRPAADQHLSSER